MKNISLAFILLFGGIQNFIQAQNYLLDSGNIVGASFSIFTDDGLSSKLGASYTINGKLSLSANYYFQLDREFDWSSSGQNAIGLGASYEFLAQKENSLLGIIGDTYLIRPTGEFIFSEIVWESGIGVYRNFNIKEKSQLNLLTKLNWSYVKITNDVSESVPYIDGVTMDIIASYTFDNLYVQSVYRYAFSDANFLAPEILNRGNHLNFTVGYLLPI